MGELTSVSERTLIRTKLSMFNNARLYLNLYGGPIVLLVASYFLHSLGYNLDENPYLAQLGEYIVFAGKVSAFISAVWVVRNLWKLWRAYQGKGDLCQKCGFPETYIPNGRYGPYYKCWKCGTNCSEYKH